MSGYTKLFESILESTVWLEQPTTKVVWITMLAMADRDGYVDASVPGLAKRAGVDKAHCEQALAVFSAPDPDSRTKTNEGRRIRAVDGGWHLLNYEAYRERASLDDMKAKAAERKRRQRDREAVSRNVTESHGSHDIAEAEAEAEAETEKKTSVSAPMRVTPLQPRRRRDAAWEGPRVYVPQRLHSDFVALRGATAEAEAALLAWYERVSIAWTTGERRDEEPGPDMFGFWKARYAEQWPPAQAKKRTSLDIWADEQQRQGLT